MSAGAITLQITTIERRFGNKLLNMRFVVGPTNALLMVRVMNNISFDVNGRTEDQSDYEMVAVPLKFRTVFHIICGSSFLVDDGSASDGKYTAGNFYEQDLVSFVRKSREIGFDLSNDTVKYLVAGNALSEDELLMAEAGMPRAKTILRMLDKTLQETTRQIFKDWMKYRTQRQMQYSTAKERIKEKLALEQLHKEKERLIVLYEDDEAFGAF